MAARKKNSIK
ncbi:hypothetical protein VTL71DRAFT_7377 [Oculimacula yallundae]|uniref:Uncharacterized protein n=1 Tax=Oculimacula yallundae TaxID=86028 RepID=A0ABR4BXD1_9HELO